MFAVAPGAPLRKPSAVAADLPFVSIMGERVLWLFGEDDGDEARMLREEDSLRMMWGLMGLI